MTAIDRNLFAQQIESHLDRLYGAALRLTRHPGDAEDLVAETAARAWSSIATLHDAECFVPWMMRIMTNTYISERRRASNRLPHEPYVEEPDDDGTPFSLFDRLHQPFLLWFGNPEHEFLNGLLHDDIEAALAKLPEPFRLVVMLSDMEGLTYQEIAVALDVPVGTVRSRLARARGQLQKALWQHGEERGLTGRARGGDGGD